MFVQEEFYGPIPFDIKRHRPRQGIRSLPRSGK